jgi:hypothetical protein
LIARHPSGWLITRLLCQWVFVCIRVEQGKRAARQVHQDLFAHEGMEEAIIVFITLFFILLCADDNLLAILN